MLEHRRSLEIGKDLIDLAIKKTARFALSRKRFAKFFNTIYLMLKNDWDNQFCRGSTLHLHRNVVSSCFSDRSYSKLAFSRTWELISFTDLLNAFFSGSDAIWEFCFAMPKIMLPHCIWNNWWKNIVHNDSYEYWERFVACKNLYTVQCFTDPS